MLRALFIEKRKFYSYGMSGTGGGMDLRDLTEKTAKLYASPTVRISFFSRRNKPNVSWDTLRLWVTHNWTDTSRYLGLSCRTVPAPTRIASWIERKPCVIVRLSEPLRNTCPKKTQGQGRRVIKSNTWCRRNSSNATEATTREILPYS